MSGPALLLSGIATSAAPAPAGWVRRVVGYLLTTLLAGVGGMSAMLGAGLALIGVCCGGSALAAGSASAVAAASVAGTYSRLFLTVGVVLGVAAFVVYRRVARAAAGSRSPAGSSLATEGC